MTDSEKISRESYIMMVQGLEQMADLYKHAKNPALQKKLKKMLREEGVLVARTICRTARRKLQTAATDFLKRRKRICEQSNHSVRAYFRLLRKSRRNSITEGSALNNPRPPLSYGAERYFRDGRVAVYMAMFGNYDRILEPVIQPDNIDYYILTDREMPQDSKWKLLRPEQFIPAELLDKPVLCNRWCKMHPHLVFPDYDASIYLDSNILVVSDLTPFVSFLDSFPVAMFRHGRRNCVYQEVLACIKGRRDTRENLTRHEQRLRAQGIPENWGLLEAPIIARLHMDGRCVALMESWWNNYLSGSCRDQLSLIETLWQNGLAPEKVGTLGENVNGCNLIIKTDHRMIVRK